MEAAYEARYPNRIFDPMRVSVITKINGAAPAVLTMGLLGAGASR
jgi:hypothetical protein